jgi:hypothetical protein
MAHASTAVELLDTEGEIPGRDVGDYVITLGETGQRIVVEAKSESEYDQPQIKEEMEEAIRNRNAEYGIFVAQSETDIPNKVGYFQEFDKEILSVALSEDGEDDFEPSFLNIAFNWARMRTVQSFVDAEERIEAEAIQAQVEEARDSINRFSVVKQKCGSIETTAQDIKAELDEIKDSVNKQLDGIITELSKEKGFTEE